jgi:hypothetical protein
MLFWSIGCTLNAPGTQDTAFVWPFGDGDAAEAAEDSSWAADVVVLSWAVVFSGGRPVAHAADNRLHITAATIEWGGNLDEPAGHCTARRSLDGIEWGDELSASGAVLGSFRSEAGADIVALGDCGRLEMPQWEGSPAHYLSEVLLNEGDWVIGIGPTGDSFDEYAAYAMGGFTQLGQAVALTNAVFVLDLDSREAQRIEGIEAVPDGLVYAPPWYAIWTP